MSKNTASLLFELTKPRALVMIIFTTVISYLIAITEPASWPIILHLSFGTALSGGGSLALNQWMERKLDARMKRTRERPLPSGRLSPTVAFVFGFTIMMVGYGWLWYFVNLACCIATVICGVSYLLMYTPMKLTTSFSSFVGAIPGGMLPVMGWTAARDQMEVGAWVLFTVLFLWQIPHALIISIRHKEDYASVGMKQLPIVSDNKTSNRQLLLNTLVLIPVSLLPYFLNMTEEVYPLIAGLLGLGLTVLSIQYITKTNEQTAKRLFISLSAYLPLLLLAMYFDKPH